MNNIDKTINFIFCCLSVSFFIALLLLGLLWIFQQFPPLNEQAKVDVVGYNAPRHLGDPIFFDGETRLVGKPTILNFFNSPTSSAFSETIITATWYSREHCLNCHPKLITASGIKLPEDGMNAAYDNAPLNSYVWVKYQDKIIRVKVIDRIGDSTKIDLLPMAFSSLEDLDKGRILVEVITCRGEEKEM